MAKNDDSVVRVDWGVRPPGHDGAVVDDQLSMSPVSSRYGHSVSNESDIDVCGNSNFDVPFDDLMHKAYGATLIKFVDGDQDSKWYPCWLQLIQHSGNHYTSFLGVYRS